MRLRSAVASRASCRQVCTAASGTDGAEQITRQTHDRLRKQLVKLESREQRLIDLAADGLLSRLKILERSNALQVERSRIEASLKDTNAELEVGAERLRSCLGLVQDPVGLYTDASDQTRRLINSTFFERFYLDDQPLAVTRDVLKPPFDEIKDANWMYQHLNGGWDQEVTRPGSDRVTLGDQRPVLADVLTVGGSSKGLMVEVVGRYSNRSDLLKGLHRVRRQRDLKTPGRVAVPIPRVHSVQRRLTQATLDQLVSEYEAGTPTTDLMESYELGKGTVLGVLRRAGVQMRNQGLAASEIGRAIALYESGVALKQIGSQLGCDAETVRKELRAAGLTMRKPWERV